MLAELRLNRSIRLYRFSLVNRFHKARERVNRFSFVPQLFGTVETRNNYYDTLDIICSLWCFVLTLTTCLWQFIFQNSNFSFSRQENNICLCFVLIIYRQVSTVIIEQVSLCSCEFYRAYNFSHNQGIYFDFPIYFRMPAPRLVSERQWEILLKFMEANPDVAKCAISNEEPFKQETNRRWAALASSLNCDSTGCTKIPAKWRDVSLIITIFIN